MTYNQLEHNDLKKNHSQQRFTPILSWAGGKRWFFTKYAHLLPQDYGRYIEPFLGAGSVYFHMQPEQAILGDLNEELILAYRGIQLGWDAIERSLKYRQRAHNSDANYYYRVRDRVPSNLIQRASRFIYLNRTCFNGIFRVNLQGKFNVPRGSKNKVILDTDNFQSMSNLLLNAQLRVSDFELLINEATTGDFVFSDPPYTVRHNYNGFIKYNEVLFSWADQQRLASALHRAAMRGVKVICTNANHESVRDLYRSPEFELLEVARNSSISAKSSSRKKFEELIVRANI